MPFTMVGSALCSNLAGWSTTCRTMVLMTVVISKCYSKVCPTTLYHTLRRGRSSAPPAPPIPSAATLLFYWILTWVPCAHLMVLLMLVILCILLSAVPPLQCRAALGLAPTRLLLKRAEGPDNSAHILKVGATLWSLLAGWSKTCRKVIFCSPSDLLRCHAPLVLCMPLTTLHLRHCLAKLCAQALLPCCLAPLRPACLRAL